MSLAPGEIVDPVERAMSALIYETIYRVDGDLRQQAILGRVVPGSLVADNTSCLMEMQVGALWGDGTPITMDDLLFSIECYLNLSAYHRAGALALTGVSLAGADRLELTFASGQNEASVKGILEKIPMISRDAYLGDCETYKTSAKLRYRPMGSGWYIPLGYGIEDFTARGGTSNSTAFLFAGQRPQTASLMENPSRQLDPPEFHQVVFSYYPSPTIAFGSLVAGDVDFLANVPPSVVMANPSQPNVAMEPRPQGRAWSLLINHRNPFLSQRHVREALAHAIDRRKHMREVMGFQGSEIDNNLLSGPFAPTDHNACTDCEAREYDPQRACELLRSNKAAYDRFQLRDGGQLKLVYQSKGVDNALVLMPLRISSDLMALESSDKVAPHLRTKIRLDLKSVQQQDEFENYLRENDDWDLALVEWIAEPSGVHIARLFGAVASKSDVSTLNFGNYVSDRMEIVIENILGQNSVDEHRTYCQTAHKLANEDLPHVFLWNAPTQIAYRTHLIINRIHPDNTTGLINTWHCP